MHSSSPPVFRRFPAYFLCAFAALLACCALAPRASALTSASLAASNLPGKTLRFTITGGNAPFETSGGFTVVFGTNGTYTMPIADGNAAMRSGTYSVRTDSVGTVIRFDGYIVNNSTVEVVIIPTGTDLRSQFEMYATGANKNGVVVFDTGSTGGTSGAPSITSATTTTATVGSPFTYAITTNPAATSYTNAGGSAPIAINPTTGVVSGTFTSAGTFTFSFTASNAGGSSAVTTVTVTATAGSGGGNNGGVNGTITDNDLIPAALVGKTLAFTITSPTNTLNDGPNTYSVLFQSAQLLQRTATGFTWNPTSYTAATAFGDGNVRFTTITTFGTWSNSATGYGTRMILSQTNGIGRFSIVDVNSSTRANSGTFTIGGATTPITNAPDISALAGTYSGQQFTGVPGPTANAVFGAFVATVTPGGVLSAQGGTITGRVAANGDVTFDATGSNIAFGYTTGRIDNGRLTATGQLSAQGRLLATYRIDATRAASGTAAATSAITAPANLVGYRNRVGQTFEFAVTGATGGAVWGTDVYTDDSIIARAAVHAGVVAVGETRVVTVTILPGQGSYPASTRNNVSTSAWGAWSGSYSFAGAGAVIANSVATARPALATGFTAATPTLSAGGRLVLPISVSGGGTYVYQWYLNGTLIAGATVNPYVVASVGSANAGSYTVDVTNALGTTRLTAGTVTITSVGAPVLALQPISKTVSPGGTFTMATNASGTGNAYQWFRNGTTLAGETGAILLRQNVSASDAGDYTVRVTNSAGNVTSSAGTITLSPTASRPANISVRASVAAGQTIQPGFFIAGVGTKRVIIRAVGPGLAQFGVTGTMSEPKLEVFRSGVKLAENDNWDGTTATTDAFASVGAFGFPAGSRDATIVANLAAGQSYNVIASGVANSSGIVLIEVYDADAPATSTSRLTNVSVRGDAGTGDATLILGLVIGGQGQRTLLVRGVGPGLAAFGVPGTLADPRLQIYDASQRAVLANDNWGQADFLGELVQATNYVGAFALEPGSRDAATLSLLDPGAYSIHVSGAGNTTGEALVEVYEVP